MNPDAREVLLVGGPPDLVLAWCRLVAAEGHRAAVLRWNAGRTFADTSRHCAGSVWLGPVERGVAQWLERLSDWLRNNPFTDVWPLDALAHELLCSGRWQPPAGTRVIGPDAAAYARGADRLAAYDVARAAGLELTPGLHLPRGAQAPSLDLPCIVLPQRAAAIEDDEPARFATRVVAAVRALDHKLRDDLPRVGLFVQPLPEREGVDICVAALDGELKAVVGARHRSRQAVPEIVSPTSEWVAVARTIVNALRWSGLLVIACERAGDQIVVRDLQCGPAEWLAGAGMAGAELVREVLGPSVRPPRASSDPLPRLARLADRVTQLAGKLGIRARALGWRHLGGVAATRRLERTDTILLVCKGNINRSLVAEQVLRRHGFSRVTSAGLLPMSGRRPSRAAERYIEEVLDLRCAALRSSTLRRAIARLPRIDVVICFERRHVVELLQLHPELRGKVHLLTTLAGGGGPIDIADPHGATDETYLRCFERIDALLHRAMQADATADAPAAALR